MRIKIIAVNALIVALVGLLSFLLVRSSLSSATGNKDQATLEAQNDVNGAAGRLQLDGLRAERWLSAAAGEQPHDRRPHEGVAQRPGRRGDQALRRPRQPDEERSAVRAERADARRAGRLERQDRGPQQHEPEPRRRPGRHLRRSQGDAHAGALGVRHLVREERPVPRRRTSPCATPRGHRRRARHGRPLNDTLSRVSEATTGRALVLVVPQGDGFLVVGTRRIGSKQLDDAIDGVAKDMLKNALVTGQTDGVRDGDQLVAASPLPAFEDGKRALLVAAAPASLIAGPDGPGACCRSSAPWPSASCWSSSRGWLLGNYITRPINMLEEGLLAILNGQADKRFELDHAELGGLAFRIDQLLNQLMGVEEDTTDDEGRVSRAPSARELHRRDGGRRQARRRAASSRSGRRPPPRGRAAGAQYYARIYREYIAAKKAIGEATDHITEQAFATRIQGMEQEAAQKHGQPRALPGAGAEQRGRAPRRSPCREAADDAALPWLRLATMGLFDLFKRRKRDEGLEGAKQVRGARASGQKGVDKRAQNYDRQEAIAGPGRDGDGRGGRRRCSSASRSTSTRRSPTRKRRTSAFHGILRAGKDAIEPVRAFAAKAESLAWPMKIMKELLDEEEYIEELLRWLSRWDTEYAKFIDPKVQILAALEEHKQPEHPRARSSASSRTSTSRRASTPRRRSLAQDDEAAAPCPRRTSGRRGERSRADAGSPRGSLARGWAVPEDERDAVRKRRCPPASSLDADGPRRRSARTARRRLLADACGCRRATRSRRRW